MISLILNQFIVDFDFYFSHRMCQERAGLWRRFRRKIPSFRGKPSFQLIFLGINVIKILTPKQLYFRSLGFKHRIFVIKTFYFKKLQN